MIYIYFTGEYEDKTIKFISEDLNEFRIYIVNDFMNYYYNPNNPQCYDEIPSFIEVWDKENKRFKRFWDRSIDLNIVDLTFERLTKILEEEL